MKILTRNESQLTSFSITSNNLTLLKGSKSFDRPATLSDETEEELSDSNDSVFSSGSSIDSILNSQDHLLNEEAESIDLRDIYLGGSCALRTNWRGEAIAMLSEHDISYHMPQLHESLLQNGDSDGRLSTSPPSANEPCSSKSLEQSSSNDSGIGTGQNRNSYRTSNGTVICPTGRRMLNLSLLESSRVLLFVISNETRSLAPMTLAAHCLGLGYNVVLCVQMLSTDNCTIGDDKVCFTTIYFQFEMSKFNDNTVLYHFQLTPAAIKDYNRGRSYLIDLARRQDVPVFSDVKQAVECAIEKVKQCNCRTST